MEEIRNLDPPKLVERFENDIIYDCHSLRAKFGRSQAQRELVQKGRESLRPIVEHIRLYQQTPPTSYPLVLDDLLVAWGMLFHSIEIEVDPDRTGPQDLRDTDGWMAWAEKFAA